MPPSQTSRLSLEGRGLSRFRVHSSDGWLSAFPQQWMQSDTSNVAIDVYANNVGLALGTHTGTLTIERAVEETAGEAALYEEAQTIHVTHAVLPRDDGGPESYGR